MEVSKLARETTIACGPREVPLLSNHQQQALYYSSVKRLFTAFANCMRQLAFSAEAMNNEESSVSQLVGSPSCFRTRDSKSHGPVSE